MLDRSLSHDKDQEGSHKYQLAVRIRLHAVRGFSSEGLSVLGDLEQTHQAPAEARDNTRQKDKVAEL